MIKKTSCCVEAQKTSVRIRCQRESILLYLWATAPPYPHNDSKAGVGISRGPKGRAGERMGRPGRLTRVEGDSPEIFFGPWAL